MASDPIVREFIIAGARRRGLDPNAVLAVATGEGGLRRGAVGDNGTSGGPFQLHRGGALPADRTVGWASTDEGINYALDRIATVAKGLSGAKAVDAIVRRFERPADPDSSVRNAVGRLEQNLGGPSAPMPTSPSAPAPDGRREFATALLGATRNSGGLDTRALLNAVLARRATAAAPTLAPAPSSAQTPAPPTPAQANGMDPDFDARISAMIAASGGRVKRVSGWRSYDHQAALYAAALKKYGNEHEARRWVAPPGKSKHGEGVAADLGGDLRWAHENAAKFGIHFPLSWESWHAEPLGSRS